MHKLLFLIAILFSEMAFSQYYIVPSRYNIVIVAPFIGYDTEQALNVGGSLAYFSIKNLNVLGISADASAGTEKMSIGSSLHIGGLFDKTAIVPITLKYARYYKYNSANYAEFVSVGGYLGRVIIFLGVDIKEDSLGILGANYYFN